MAAERQRAPRRLALLNPPTPTNELRTAITTSKEVTSMHRRLRPQASSVLRRLAVDVALGVASADAAPLAIASIPLQTTHHHEDSK
jgi:hypothetical protein